MDIDRCIKLANEEHFCPYCKERLSCCEAPPFHIGDGLGWGSDILFICLNNNCSIFANSWEQFEERYGHKASCRYMLLPGEDTGMTIMVGGADAFTGSIIDIDAIQKQNAHHRNQKSHTSDLETCVAENNLNPALCLILDNSADLAVRKSACELLVDLNNLDCIDPIRNHNFIHGDIEMYANMSIKQLLENNHRKECPYCMEIIKSQAKMCKHCSKEV